MKTKNTSFLAWFKKRAGRPIMSDAEFMKLTHETLPSLRNQLERAEVDFQQMCHYRTARVYAMYAWNTKRKKKP